MQSEAIRDKIGTNPRWLICPECRRMKLARLLPGTQVKNLAMHCRKCGREVIVNILPEPEPK